MVTGIACAFVVVIVFGAFVGLTSVDNVCQLGGPATLSIE
jgi:hypothetical protein